MKKLLILFAAVGIALFASCEKERSCPEIPYECEEQPKSESPEEGLSSLAGTYWKGSTDVYVSLIVDEMVFTSSTATFTSTEEDGDIWSFSGRYIYDPSAGVFVMPNESEQVYPIDEEAGSIPDLEGIIKNDTMTFNIWESFDRYRVVELKKQ